MVTLVNRAKVATATTGTGTITLGSAESGYQTFADAGVVNADVVRYVIEDGTAWEIGTGTYTATGTTLTRTVSESSNADAAIVLTGSATVFIGATAEDILSNVVEDTTPQLGGNLDVQTREITTSTTNGNVKLTPNGTGVVEVKGAGGNDGTLQINCSANSHGVKIKSPPHSAAASYTLTLPDDDGAASEFLQTDGSGNLSWAAGGGGADLYAANESSPSAQPSATGANAIAIGDSAVSGGTRSMALLNSNASGNDSFAAAIATNSSAYGAVGAKSRVIGEYSKGSANNSTAIGYIALASGQYSMVFGNSSTSSHTDAIVIGGGASSSAADQITLGHTDQTVRISSAYTLPIADGSANQVLTTDGSGAVTFATAGGGGASEYTIDNKTLAYTVVSGDLGKILNYTSGTVDVTLTALSSLTTGFHVSIWNSGTGVISIKPNSVDGIGVSAGNDYDSTDPLKLEMGTGVTLVNSGTYWQIYSEKAYDYYHHSVTLGANAKASNNYAMALGNRSTAGSVGSIAIGTGQGHSTTASGSHSVAIGLATASGAGSVALGKAYASGTDSFAAAITTNSASYGARQNNAVVLGQAARSTGAGGLALGNNANVSGSHGLAIGRGSAASGTYSTALGYFNTASGTNSVAFGANSTASHEDSIVLGDTASSSAINQITLGSTSDTVRISSAYTLPTADGTANQVLTTDGAGAVTFATAGGGGGADLYVANESSPAAQPTAAGANAIGIGDTAQAAGADGVAIGLQSYARAQSALGLFGDAQNTESVSIGKNSAATADGAVQLGRNGYATATDAVSLGKSRASGASSFAAAVSNNTSTYGATGSQSISIGQFTRATSGGAATFGGAFSNASGSQSLAIGRNVLAQQQASVALGQQSLSAVAGKFAYSSTNFSATGDSQHGMCVLRQSTTDATPKVMLTDSASVAASAINQIILPNNSAYFFSGTIIAREQASAGTDVGAWEIKGAIRREANAASTVLIKSTIDDFNVPTGWAVALTADTTNGGLAITVTGAAATNIRWVATVNTSEVTY